ncbi:MAG: GDP-L-fucose synthase [Proteobacteria bacterium]|nr:GDP-L-fucose synthase [Pseudomonadota bacterium]
MLEPHSRIFVAGHAGLVGSAILRRLNREGYDHLLVRRHDELDLTKARAVEEFFQSKRPEYVLLAAGKVGGIHANDSYPGEFIQQNLVIQANVIHEAWRVNVKRLLFLGSSCIYPRDCRQPIKEEYLLTGPLEATNRPYAVAKIAGVEMCWAYNRQYKTRFLAAMPTNLYGPGDNFDLENSHVLPALIRKFHAAKTDAKSSVIVWGSGTPRREFLHVDDVADACVFLMGLPDESFDSLLNASSPPLINIGCGEDLTISELVQLVRDVVGYEGEVEWDRSKPDGTPRKLLDSSSLHGLGWTMKTPLTDGIRSTYEWFLDNREYLRC